ncbi:hypothetical protein JYT53_00275 [Cytophagaceae bacterium AH-315-L13]|nr:hypothetical protein [Cytophagaceae bacterium AH-315-L13]
MASTKIDRKARRLVTRARVRHQNIKVGRMTTFKKETPAHLVVKEEAKEEVKKEAKVEEKVEPKAEKKEEKVEETKEEVTDEKAEEQPES